MAEAKVIKVLAVDDEENIIRAYQTCFDQYDEEDDIEFDLTVVNDGEAALQEVIKSKKANEPFKVAFIDIRMPKHDGVWTARKIRELTSKLQIVIVTAYSDLLPSEISKQVPPRSRLLYTQKPFHMHEIQHLAIALSEKWDLEERMRTSNLQLEADLESSTYEAIEARNKLKDSGRNLCERLTGAKAAVIITDKDSKVTATNNAAILLLGYENSQEIIGKEIHDIVENEHSCFKKDGKSVAVLINKVHLKQGDEDTHIFNIFNDNLFE